MTNGLTNSSASTNPPINNQNKTLTSNGVYTADSGYTGLGEVTVAVPPTQPVLTQLAASPSTVAQTFTPPQGYDGYDEVSVAAVTSAIDSNIASENIVAGKSILGVAGSATALNGTTLSITPSTSAQNFAPVAPANGFTSVAVAGVTSAIDANITASNIKSGVSILNVTGSLEGLNGQSKTITANGSYTPDTGYNAFTSVDVIVPSAGTITTRTCTNITNVTIPAGAKVGVYYSTTNSLVGIFPLADRKRLDYLKVGLSSISFYYGTTKEAIAPNAQGQVDCVGLSGTGVSQPFLCCSQIADGYLIDHAYDNGYIEYNDTDSYVFNIGKYASSGYGDLYVKNWRYATSNDFDIKLEFSISSAITSANDGVLFVACNKESNIRQAVYQTSPVDSDRMIVGRIGDNGTSLIIEIRGTKNGTESTYTYKYSISSFNVNTKYYLLLAYRPNVLGLSIDMYESASGNRITPTSYDSLSNVTVNNVNILALEYPFIQNCGEFKFYLNNCYLAKGNYRANFAKASSY